MPRLKSFDNVNGNVVRTTVGDISHLLEDPHIKYVEIDQGIRLPEVTPISLNNKKEEVPWNVEKTFAPSVWEVTRGDGVNIAVIDSGVDDTHDDLMGAVVEGVSFVDNDYHDIYGHGTAVAGVITSRLNARGIVGVAPEANLFVAKITNSGEGDLSNGLAALDWAITKNVDIVVMSFGFNFYSQIFKELVDKAYERGIVLVAAAGNEGSDTILYPAKYEKVIAVGATTENDELASFSSYGFDIAVVAPGEDVLSTGLSDEHVIVDGTSLAAPHVAGIIALLKSFNANLTNYELREKIENDAIDIGEPGKDNVYGYGLAIINISSENYNFTEDEYYFEVYTVASFEDESSYTLYYNSTGTVDDVTFTPGLYVIYKYIGEEIITEELTVKERGTLNLLAEPTFNDTWEYVGSSATDGFVFKDSGLKGNISTDIGDNEVGVECFNYDDIATNDFDECFSLDSTTLTLCKSLWPELNTLCNGLGSDCHTIGAGDLHPIDTSVSRREDVNAVYYSSFHFSSFKCGRKDLNLRRH